MIRGAPMSAAKEQLTRLSLLSNRLEGRDYHRIPVKTKAGTADFGTRLAGESLNRLMAVATPAPWPGNPANGNIGNVLEARCQLLSDVSILYPISPGCAGLPADRAVARSPNRNRPMLPPDTNGDRRLRGADHDETEVRAR
jgi:hypothetical protein